VAKKQHIVVVNDDTVFLDLMKELLEEEGWQVTCLRESHKAHHAIREAKPDLVILDVRMGNELTGFELIGLLTLDPTTRSIPLVVCSADSQALRQHEAQMKNQGIGIIHKPFELEDLLIIIRECLEDPRSS
jgi:CheY-like chemotaxis protein